MTTLRHCVYWGFLTSCGLVVIQISIAFFLGYESLNQLWWGPP